MSKRRMYRTKAELESKVIRISLGRYALLAEISQRERCTIDEALEKLITQQAKPKAEPEAESVKESPRQIPLAPVVFASKQADIRVTGQQADIRVTGQVEPVVKFESTANFIIRS